jgi:hypothetical protein
MVSDMTTLGGVYGIAFLSVMSMFTVANILLKYKRNKLPRTPIASYRHVLTALTFVLIGLVANITKSSMTVAYFLLYAAVTIVIVIGMFSRVQILRFIVHIMGKPRYRLPAVFLEWLKTRVKTIRDIPLMFFAKKPTLSVLNKALMYVIDNEDTNCFRIVHCYRDKEDDKDILLAFEEAAAILDRMYPKMTIELFLVQGDFVPQLVEQLSQDFNVPKNFMFMCCPGHKFPHHIGNFGGVRVITH